MIHMAHGSTPLLNIEKTTSQQNGGYERPGGKGKGEMLSEGTYFSQKMNKFQRPNVQHGDNSQQNCIIYLILAKGIDLELNLLNTHTVIMKRLQTNYLA